MSGKIVGVLGGMGPLATVEFLRLVMALTPARKDWDHLRMIVDIHPQVPSRSRHHLYGEASPVPEMIDACRRLADHPVDFIVVPCNSASAFLEDVIPHVAVPVESIVDATVAELEPHAARRVAVMGGVVTYDRRLYEQPLARRGMTLVLHDASLQRRIEGLIEMLKRGGASEEAQREFEIIVEELVRESGAGHLILACTELAMLRQTAIPVPATDSAAALARHTIRLARRPADG